MDRDIFGSHEIAYECLADAERTEQFAAAIREVVRPGDEVLELGTGTGILALLAAAAGARRVVSVEICRPMADIARRNVVANGLESVIEIVVADAVCSRDLGGPYHVLIAEMVTVGLIEEQLVPAFNNVVSSRALRSDVRCIPTVNRTFVELVDTDFTFLGFQMPTVQIEQTWQARKVRSFLSSPVQVSDVDFAAAARAERVVDPIITARLHFRARCDGTVNAVRLTSESQLSPLVVSGWTQCMNSPAVIPVGRREVRAGEELEGVVTFEMGGDLTSFQIEWC